jgi:hypothetical protein
VQLDENQLSELKLSINMMDRKLQTLRLRQNQNTGEKEAPQSQTRDGG